MFFGMPLALFPAFASGFGGAKLLGLMYAAIPARLARGHGDERLDRTRAPARLAADLGCGSVGVAITAVGFAPNLALVLVFLGFAGAADDPAGSSAGRSGIRPSPTTCAAPAGIEQVDYSAGPLLEPSVGHRGVIRGDPGLDRLGRRVVRDRRRARRAGVAGLQALRRA